MNKPPSINEIIERDGMYISTPLGDSMWPMLYSKRDTTCIVRVQGKLKKYDIALYQRLSGEYVLHRVIKVADDSYTMCGDSQLVLEYGIKDEQIIGVLDSFYRNGKFHTVNEKKYKLYAFIWCLSFKLRKFLMNIVGFFDNRQNKKRERDSKI